MEKNKQIQEAGENSQQIMAGTVIVNNNGLTEQQVKAIIDSEIIRILNENQLVANDTAQNRLNEFRDILLPKLVKAEMLDAFKEPAVQMLFKSAEKTAICSERKLDYELLAELLIHRTKKNDITKNVAISNAVELVDKLTEDALLVLTIFHAITCFSPISGDINQGFHILDNLFGKILNNNSLPQNDNWAENLEINRIINFNTIGTTIKMNDFWFENFTSYSQMWIKKDSEELKQIYEELKKHNIPMDIIIDNPLDTNFVTLKILQKGQVKDLMFNRQIVHLPIIQNGAENIQMPTSMNIPIKITKEQENVICNIFNNTKFKNNGLNNERTLFEQKLNEFQNLRSINTWWNNNITKFSIRLNSIGKVIAHTNVKNIDPTLPDLD